MKRVSPAPATEAHEPEAGVTSEALGFRLTVVDGSDAQTWEASAERCAIGSQEGNDLRVVHPTVSRFHCEVVMEGGEARVRDLGSRNGTRVDGVRVTDAFLRSGSSVGIGAVTLRFELLGRTSRVPISSRRSFHGLVAESVAMRRALALVERGAVTDTTILLEGETGTGKGAAASAIHRASARSAKPMLVVDCGAIPANLLESELFGHERNAFTGAGERRIGAFEEADGGTVFLDEIGELPIDLQPKLLRAIESREIRRVGSNQHRKVDVRIIAATHRDLRSEVNAARFRADLYFRLAVLRIRLPPLRERPDDVPALVRELLGAIGATAEQARAFETPEMMASLKRAAWPGNVRELRNHLERCLVLQDVLPVELEASPAEAASAEAASVPRAASPVDARLPYASARRRALDAFERDYVAALLELHEGRITAAASAAGMDRVYLYKLARRHRLRSSE